MQKKLFQYILLCLLTIVFLCVPCTSFQAKTTEDLNVIALAKQHCLSSALIVKKKDANGNNCLVCYSNGKRLRKKRYWFYANGSVYYNNKKACVQTGSFTYKKRHFISNKQGKLLTNHLWSAGKHKYYYGRDGIRLSGGWKKAGGKYRYFSSRGVMATNQWVDTVYVGSDGCVVKELSRYRKPGRYTSDDQGWVITANNTKKDHLFIIGASRVEQMSQAVSSDPCITFIASCCKGIQWLNQTAIPVLDFWLSLYKHNCKVVIQLGNNDLSSVDDAWPKYKRAYHRLIKKYPDVSFYFMDVLPGSPRCKTQNSLRQEFNRRLQKNFPDQAIGGYDYLTEKGYTCTDNKHYTKATSRVIYNYILRMVDW